MLSWGYGIGIGYQNRKFDRGRGVSKLDRPVISIGNLSAGGTGKTPMVHWVAKELQAMGKHPAIAMRGYRAVPGEMGDEEREHRRALPGVPVVAQADRTSGLRSLFESESEPAVDCVILDDGFQHRQIVRDLDIVLIDASSPPDRDALLPRGFLRDPVSSLSRADALIITHREMVSDDELVRLQTWLESKAPRCPVSIASHEWRGIDIYQGSRGVWQAEHGELDRFSGERVLGVCAIGNPDGFFGIIEYSGWDLVDRIVLPDHDPFDTDQIESLSRRAESAQASVVCMTRKDWVKVKDRLDSYCPFRVVVPDLGIRFETGEQMLRSQLRSVVC